MFNLNRNVFVGLLTSFSITLSMPAFSKGHHGGGHHGGHHGGHKGGHKGGEHHNGAHKAAHHNGGRAISGHRRGYSGYNGTGIGPGYTYDTVNTVRRPGVIYQNAAPNSKGGVVTDYVYKNAPAPAAPTGGVPGKSGN